MTRTWRFLLVLLVWLSAWGCGPNSDGTDSNSDGANAEDTFFDGQQLLDATEEWDERAADLPSESMEDLIEPTDVVEDELDFVGTPVTLSVVPFETWQRAPVNVLFDCDMGSTQEPAVATVKYSTNGSDFYLATPLLPYSKPDSLTDLTSGSHRFVWDSMVDVQTDTDAWVQVTLLLATNQTISTIEGPFSLRNRQNRDRVLLVTSSINGNSDLRAVRFSHQDGLSWDGVTHEVGVSPVRVFFDVPGRRAVTLNDANQTLTFVFVDEDGTVTVEETIELGINAKDGFYSEDGSMLYLLVYNSQPDAGTYAWEVNPHTGLPLPGTAPQKIAFHYVAPDMVPLPNNEGYATVEGSQKDPRGAMFVSLVGFDGSVGSQVYFASEGSIPMGIALSPDGDHLTVIYYNFFGEGDAAVAFRLEDGQLVLVNSVALTDPDDLEYSSDGQTVVVSEAQGNKVTALNLSATGELSKEGSFGLGLATSLASTRWGPDQDLFFVATVSASTGGSGVGLFRVEGGTLQSEGAFEMGVDSDLIPHDVAIQP